MKRPLRSWLGAFAALVLCAGVLQAEEGILVKSGEAVAFLGDSITQQGAGNSYGYVNLVISGLKANGIDAQAVPAGISGHKSDQMLARLKKDVLDKKPAWMTLSCGVNDVWHQDRNAGIPLDKYKENITAIVDQALAAGARVVILTATMIQENPDDPHNKKLVDYNAFLRELAAAKKCPLADLNADMQKKLTEMPAASGNRLTVDGVHMNLYGNIMMATGVLRALGLNDEQLKKAAEYWQANTQVKVPLSVNITMAQFEALQKMAAEQKKQLPQLLEPLLQRATEGLLKEAK